MTMKKAMIYMLFLMPLTVWAAKSDLKPRLVVCTDIAPADVEPDDMESMVRLMAYADCFEIEALITSVGWNCDPYPLEWQQYLFRPLEWQQYLFRVITAYAKDVPNLMRRSGQKKHLSLKKENASQELGYWPSAEYITSRAVMGSMYGGIKAIGEKNDSPGSELLIRLADEDDPRPIYVAAWGGANTLAQAIWRVKQTRSDDEVRNFVRKFRLFTITDQDMKYDMRMNRAYSSHMWLRKDFQDDLQFIWDEGAWHREYPNYKWGVEGDTPSFLYVMPNGLNDPEDPHQCGWAGYHVRGLCADSLTTAWTSWQEPLRNISVGYKRRFYPDELNDFCARMQWAAEGRGNLNPRVAVRVLDGSPVKNTSSVAPLRITAKAGDTIRLDASKSFDPDGDGLTFLWWQQPEIGTTKLTIDQSDQSIVTVRIPADTKGDTVHLICEVHDDGPFRLVAYRRIIIAIKR